MPQYATDFGRLLLRPNEFIGHDSDKDFADALLFVALSLCLATIMFSPALRTDTRHGMKLSYLRIITCQLQNPTIEIVKAAVIGGRERWRRRIDGLANDLRLKLAELADEDEARAAIVARTLEDLNAFAGYALPLIEPLDGLPTKAYRDNWNVIFAKKKKR
jgi:hypothetical protein